MILRALKYYVILNSVAIVQYCTSSILSYFLFYPIYCTSSILSYFLFYPIFYSILFIAHLLFSPIYNVLKAGNAHAHGGTWHRVS